MFRSGNGSSLATPVAEAQGLRVGILGPLQVTLGGEGIRTLPAGERVVLAMLALAEGLSVRRDSLIDVLWGDDPPTTAVGIVHTYISRLRRALGPLQENGQHRVVRDGSGYRLLISHEELDLLAFRHFVGEGRDAQASEDPVAACDAFERALNQWRGEPVSDIDALWERPAVAALTEEHARVVLEFADAASACGRDDAALPHLRGLAARDGLNEALHARLLVTLAGAGRRAEALQEYERLRRRLDEELGVPPSSALRATHARIVRQDLRIRDSQAETDRWRPVFTLPASPADFTGRAADVERLVTAISPRERHPGVPVGVVSGLPGAGKTALALFCAHTVRERFPDGQLWVQLSGASVHPREPGDVLGELLRTLGVPGAAIPDGPAERAALYRSRLAGRKVLVVADDAATPGQVQPLVPGTAGCALLVTSRMRLEGLDGARLVLLDAMTGDDAAELVARMIGQDRVAAEPEATADFVVACGALPLALRIAGAKLAARPSWPVSVMVGRLTGEHGRLRELEVGETSVRASITSSYQSLPERSQRAFRLLSLAGSADFPEWVAGALLAEADGRDVIDDLTNRSLLIPVSTGGYPEPRYRLHDLLRDFAAESLNNEAIATKNAARERLIKGWLQLASAANENMTPEPYFPQRASSSPQAVIPARDAQELTADPVGWFATERLNLLAAIENACEAGHLTLAEGIASSLSAYQHHESHYDDAERIWTAIAAHAKKSQDLTLEAYALLRLGASLVERGRSADAVPWLNRCIEESRQSGCTETLALALYWHGCSVSDLDDFDEAQRDADEGEGLARQAGSQFALLMNLRLQSTVLTYQGSSERAVRTSEQAVAIAVTFDVAAYELAALHTLAFVCTRAGQYRRAADVCMRQIALSRELGESRREALARAVLGDAYQGLGLMHEAIDSWLAATPVFRDHHAHRYLALCLLRLGNTYLEVGNVRDAVACLEESLSIFEQLRLPSFAKRSQDTLERLRAIQTGPAIVT